MSAPIPNRAISVDNPPCGVLQYTYLARMRIYMDRRCSLHNHLRNKKQGGHESDDDQKPFLGNQTVTAEYPIPHHGALRNGGGVDESPRE